MLNTFCEGQQSWKELSKFPGEERTNAICFTLNGKAYIGSGINKRGAELGDFWEYDPQTNKWTPKADYPGYIVNAGSAFAAGGKGYVCLGYNSWGGLRGELYEYNPVTNTWLKKADYPGAARMGACAFTIGDTGYVGTGTNGNGVFYSDFYMYVPAANKWIHRADFGGGVRGYATAFVIGQTAYVGTGLKSKSSATKDIWKFNKKTNSWTYIEDIPGSFNSGMISFAINGKAYVGTGFNLNYKLNDFYIYQPDSNNWRQIDSMPDSFYARNGAVAFSINKFGYIATGNTSSATKDFWQYSPCPANIISQPESKTANVGSAVSFAITAFDKNVKYQWQVDSDKIFINIKEDWPFSGTTTPQLTISEINKGYNNHKFRCIALSNVCQDTSLAVPLFVNCIKLIKKQPLNATAANGTSSNFNIAGQIPAIAFQWQENTGTGFKNIDSSSKYSGINNDTLQVLDLVQSNNLSKYRCIASYGGCYDTSGQAILKVFCSPIIKIQPVNKKGYNLQSLTFETGAYEISTAFQWQINKGAGFEDLNNGGQYSGALSDTMLINPLRGSDNGYKFRCILNYKSCTDTSRIVLLTVQCSPHIKSHPQDISGVKNSKVTFSASSELDASSYLWQSNSGSGFINLSDIGQFSGSNTGTLTHSDLTLANHQQLFRCIIKADGCLDTSNAAELSVICPLQLIGKQPVNASGPIDGSASFSISALDTVVLFDWQSSIGAEFQPLSNWGQYSGTSGPLFTVNKINAGNDNQKFRCVVNSYHCFDTSNVVVLKIGHSSINFNDKNALMIFPNPVDRYFHLDILSAYNINNYKMFNAEGQVVLSGSLEPGENKINVEKLAKGLYILQTYPERIHKLILKN